MSGGSIMVVGSEAAGFSGMELTRDLFNLSY